MLQKIDGVLISARRSEGLMKVASECFAAVLLKQEDKVEEVSQTAGFEITGLKSGIIKMLYEETRFRSGRPIGPQHRLSALHA